jgi:GntR family transcriptional regulator/MocR family aminotransferase
MLQAVVADLMIEGHFERHLRRMQTEYRARLEALAEAAARYCRGALELRPVTTGLHAVADLTAADENLVAREALSRGVETMPLSAYRFERGGSPGSGLVLGFGAVPPKLVLEGMKRLAEAIEVTAALGTRKARKGKSVTADGIPALRLQSTRTAARRPR